MGKTIEQIALARHHTIPHKIDVQNTNELKNIRQPTVDVAIEFTQPDSAFDNIKTCLQNGIPVVSGTTGWLHRKNEIEKICIENDGAFFYASNFSIGVNLFFHLNKILARIMNNLPQYDVSMEEIHHTAKKDAPSGTAITIAEGILENIKRKNRWTLGLSTDKNELSLFAKRIDPFPGQHSVLYSSPIDSIEIKHTAHSREGFAAGAVTAAEWLVGKKGIFGMEDMLRFDS